jgi:hypothetical protein
MEKQITAVEWLEQRLFDKLGMFTKGDIDQAKEMEKEQMKETFKLLLKAHVDWTVFSNKILDKTFEDYYNKTFKNN